MGGLIIADIVVEYSGLYKWSPYLQIPIKIICTLGNAVGVVWVFVCSGNAKEQLRRKYPGLFGRIFDVLDTRCGLLGEGATVTVRGVNKTTEL